MRKIRFPDAASAVVIDANPRRQRRTMEALQLHGIEVVGLSTIVERAAELTEVHLCDVLVIALGADISSHTVSRVLRSTHRHRPDLVSVMIVEHDDPAIIAAALAAGAFAALGESTSLDEVARLAAQALAGRRRAGEPTKPEPFALPRLTRRETEILQLVAEGSSNPDVARLLWITKHTVKFHLANTYRKLGIRNRFEASQWASKNGLIPPSEERPEGDASTNLREPLHPIRPPSGAPPPQEPPDSGDQPDDFDSPRGSEEVAA